MAETRENKILGETLYMNQLISGIKCYIIPKKGYVQKQAMICTKYGSLDNIFEINGKKQDMPKGIAHFLEHKLFEEKEGNLFDKFAKLGADVNAFTNFTTTAYYFNTIDHFDDSLRLLLDFVGHPHFTDENVQKEKGIIEQEIKMYDDDPMWIVYFNMLKGLYSSHPARENIAGTVDSIHDITKDMLYDCYNSFYVPQNMAVVCAGDFEIDKIYDIIDRNVSQKEETKVKRFYGNEPEKINKSFLSEKMSVSIPLFHIGFKDNDFQTSYNKKDAATRILLDILAGESSELFLDLFSKGLVDDSFGASYMGNLCFGTSIIGGSSSQPQKVYEEVKKQIEKLKYTGISGENFLRIKNKHIGRFVRRFNSIDGIASGQVDCFAKDTNLIAAFDALDKITIDDITQRLYSHLKDEFSVLSIIE